MSERCQEYYFDGQRKSRKISSETVLVRDHPLFAFWEIYRPSLMGAPVIIVTPKHIALWMCCLINSTTFTSTRASIIITSYFSPSMTEPIANNARGISKNTAFGLYKIIFFLELIFRIVDNVVINVVHFNCKLTSKVCYYKYSQTHLPSPTIIQLPTHCLIT